MDNSNDTHNDQSLLETKSLWEGHSPTLPDLALEAEKLRGAICPNCGAMLEARKCKLFCPRLGCGYLVTCSEW
ncbi:hypothetical protein B1R32_109126 [Abditibacterium utsteinense]|uniref:Uncharacterized protein n=1 Tax=Abditibacterium utsteinense TaxID=1960156 RepID=A0A2S8SSN1_9BACT|nr:hypothetical protein [Abditibacterium utsteinense]PQV63786.1 hypothetical protein B1R32_109126 [Abditibacterium utsteinense]